ncbi:uncharacterized protein LOC108680238 isoform X2 [Hyalella azteca]|uniref:Uncharacterized protein LOC108680238 isoform X1 n=1 Tax=Hyalella azteca TaxID=294128 RepID=A0A8B7PGT1_HYAAZ|nr:uncharacterized protein LOC108680238 isoform X1 [Hyalella azteca]XP_018024516.1 uncharacterized protein LOC108680238 isoform X2 [Hyalella azteca]
MSSTLPRIRSLTAGAESVSSPSLAVNFRDRVRPVSLYESSWGRVALPVSRPLQRCPSQATNLATTVPCSLVTKKLGGRHTPTRSSLRHSRMVVLHRTNGVAERRWQGRVGGEGDGLGRVGALVITAQTLVALLMGGLVCWALVWAPNSIPFREVPHYAAIPLLVSGLLGVLLLACCSKRPKRRPANILKIMIVLTSFMAVVACLCVCIFAALKLVHLAPMRCREVKEVVALVEPSLNDSANPTLELSDNNDAAARASGDRAISNEGSDSIINNSSLAQSVDIDGTGDVSDAPSLAGEVNSYVQHSGDGSTDGASRNQRSDPVFDDGVDDEDETLMNYDGSGEAPPELNLPKASLELESPTTRTLPAMSDPTVLIEKAYCVCESWKDHWKQSLRYPDLSCVEVNRVLPVLIVATCIVTAGGAILSGVVIYLIWASRASYYNPIRPTEIRPMMKSSSLKRSVSLQCRSNGVPYWNGSPSTNGHSRYIVN